jgi:hypothetical protein
MLATGKVCSRDKRGKSVPIQGIFGNKMDGQILASHHDVE